MPFICYTTDDDNCTPYKKHRYDAGWDLRSANEDFVLKPGAKVVVDTGLKLKIPKGYVGIIAPRSGLGCNYRVGLANTVGVIDSEYRGEIKVFLVNDGNVDVQVNKYDRICQIMYIPVLLQSMRKVGYIEGTERGENGFGHSGIE